MEIFAGTIKDSLTKSEVNPFQLKTVPNWILDRFSRTIGKISTQNESGSFPLAAFFWSTSFCERKNKVHSIPISGSSLHSTCSFILSTTDQQYCQCLYYYLIIVYHYIIYHISGNHQPTTLSVSLTSTSATTLLSPHPHFCMMYSMMVK